MILSVMQFQADIVKMLGLERRHIIRLALEMDVQDDLVVVRTVEFVDPHNGPETVNRLYHFDRSSTQPSYRFIEI